MGTRIIGPFLMSKLNWIGRVLKFSRCQPKRVLDRDFVNYYTGIGHCVEDIPKWRNTRFSGNESYTAFAKYAHDEPVLNDQQQAALLLSGQWLQREFYPYMCSAVIISADAVIEGTDGGNSPGFPWNKIHESCDEFYNSDDCRLLEEYWLRSETPEGSFTLWNSFLKEELRSDEKIRVGDIRQINGCSVEFKVAMNRYCLDMNEKFYAAHLKTPSAVGINKYYGGWDRLYRKLAVHDCGFSLDVKRWDAHFPRCLMEIIRDFRWQCIARPYRSIINHQRFINLYEQIIKSITVLNYGELLQTNLGNPSGSPNTAVDNTLGLYLLVAYSWIRACASAGITPEFSQFTDNVALALYGDDNTFTASPEGLTLLNFATVHQYAAELGFLVTDGGSSEPRPVIELDFLSSKFVTLRTGMVVSRPKDGAKALASMAFRGNRCRLDSWSRACAHRINSFWDPSSYAIADGYCQYLLRLLDTQSEAEGWSTEWCKAKSQYLTERQLWNLYCAAEGRA